MSQPLARGEVQGPKLRGNRRSQMSVSRSVTGEGELGVLPAEPPPTPAPSGL